MILALRRKADVKVRQPLAKALILIVDKRLLLLFTEEIKSVIRTETNVKEIAIVSDDVGIALKKAKANFKTLGAKCGKSMKEVAAKIAAFAPADVAVLEREKRCLLSLADGSSVELLAEDVEIITEDVAGSLSLTENGVTLALDVTITEALRLEGLARELVNRIQNLRKDSGLEITDRIRVCIERSPAAEEVVAAFEDYIKGQVLAVEIALPERVEAPVAFDIDGLVVKLSIVRD
jgi:isoleucyl-tRNA synthetase